jgi:hypothetical protein
LYGKGYDIKAGLLDRRVIVNYLSSFQMGKNTKQPILFLICFLFTQGAFSQLPENLPDYLKQSLLRFLHEVPREELFLHTDREEYIAGENVWFTGYLIDRQSFKPSLNSRIVYVELLDPENRPVVQKRILMDKGTGPGQIGLPDTLGTGTYTLRAYTSLMKNFLPENCFVKELPVYNAVNTSAFKGRPVRSPFPGKATGNPATTGSRKIGVMLNVNNSNPDYLEIIVHADEAYRIENNSLSCLFIQTHGNINRVSMEKLTGETTRITVQRASLGSGIHQVTLFNAKGEPAGERYCYTPARDNVPYTLIAVDSCDRRNKVGLEIEPGKEGSAAGHPARLSISVAPLTNTSGSPDMKDYLVFGTEYGFQPWSAVKGRKISELPAREIDSLLLEVSSNWINWSAILSGARPDNRYGMEKEDHFLAGKLITGDHRAAPSGEFVLLCMPGKVAVFQYAMTDQEGNFSFRLPADEELEDLIIMPDDVSKNYGIVMESPFTSQVLQPGNRLDTVKSAIPPAVAKMGVNFQVQSIYGVPGHGDSLTQANTTFQPVRFYGKPDVERIMDEFIKLPVMEEVIFEILPHVSLRKSKSGVEISLSDRVDNNPYIVTPCLMIDGVIITDPSLIVDLDPEIVEKIDVIKERYVVGKYLFPGIVNVITRSGDFSCVALPPYMIRLSYRVADPVRSFVSPDYSAESAKTSRIPDYRNTLFWDPSVKTDEGGRTAVTCWSSDNTGDYVINVQGITPDGRIISMRKTFRVK